MKNFDVIVVGGGASGMMASLGARKTGAKVVLVERNPRVGRKILATGNGRCNLTNVNTSMENFHGEDPEFTIPALALFDVGQTIGYFEKLGIAPKVEDGGKVFPMSDQASSVLDVLRFEMGQVGVELVTDALVVEVSPKAGGFQVKLEDGRLIQGSRVVLACGGRAMPLSGSDGKGYNLAVALGHSLVEVFPALVQLRLEGGFFKQIAGVKFPGTAEIISENKSFAQDRGDILFAKYGISGPPILQISRQAGDLLQRGKEAILKVSIIDTMSFVELENHLKKRFSNSPYKTVEFSLVGLVNKRLIPVLLKSAGIDKLKTLARDISDREVRAITKILTDWRFPITGTRSWPSAQVTAGGISTREVNPNSLESQLVPGLFFCGEILDIDGDCGGFNLQWAWSSGHLAGQNAGWAALSHR